MILADTVVWIDFLDRGRRGLEGLLDRNEILIHPFVVGELAMGNLRDRAYYLDVLASFPTATIAHVGEVSAFIENHKLYGRGIGYIDAHLLVSAQLTPDTKIWTFDKRLAKVAVELGLSADQEQ